MLKSVTFEITGDQRLVCDGCEQRVERLLKALPGVEKVHAQSQNQRIDVLIDTTKVDSNAIAERLGKAGYQTRVGSSTSGSGN